MTVYGVERQWEGLEIDCMVGDGLKDVETLCIMCVARTISLAKPPAATLVSGFGSLLLLYLYTVDRVPSCQSRPSSLVRRSPCK